MTGFFRGLSRLWGKCTGTTHTLASLPTERDAEEIIAKVRRGNLTYCGAPKLENLAEAALCVVRENIPGLFLEAGVALGGSAIVLSHLKGERPLYLYDVYGMIPAPGNKDGADAHKRYAEIISGSSKGLGADLYYGYVPDLLEKVLTNLAMFGVDHGRDHVTLVQGLFEATLWPPGTIALAHIDCDWYDSVRTCIDRIAPNLAVGGIVAFDDYSSYSGCRRAVDEWLTADPRLEVKTQNRSIVLRRKA